MCQGPVVWGAGGPRRVTSEIPGEEVIQSVIIQSIASYCRTMGARSVLDTKEMGEHAHTHTHCSLASTGTFENP